MLFLVTICILFGGLIIGLYVYWKYFARMVALSKKLPGPSALPIIGNGLIFYNKSSVENLEILCDLCKDYGTVVRVWIGPELYVLLTDPKDSEAVLSSSKLIDKSNVYDLIKPWLSDGLLISTGQKWRSRRKILTPAFHFKILEEFVETFDRQSTTLINNLSRSITEPVELFPIIALYALDVICESAMGVSINAQMNSESEYVKAVGVISHVIHLRMFDLWYRTNFFFQLSSIAPQQRNAVKVLHDFTDKVINDRRCELIEHAVKNDFMDEEFGIKRKKAFLDILLEATIDGEPLTDLDIREEVDTFMFEGHDTTTSGITFCLYNLANNPIIQEKCFNEIIEVMGNDKRKPISYAELNQLHYLEKAIKETLRMFPSVPIFARYLKEETTINGHTYPVGTNLVLPIYYMGKLSSLYENPEEFRPERFNDDAKEHVPFSYVPFSAGPRNCIGQKFAMLEIKSVISKMLRYYKLSLTNDSKKYPTLTAELILRPANAIQFILEPRNCYK